MSARSARVSSRTWILLVVVAAHTLLIWVIVHMEVPLAKEVETFTSVMFFVPQVTRTPHLTAAQTAPVAAPTRPARPAAASTPQPSVIPLPQSADSSTAITLPATPGAGIDWSAQIPAAATAEIDKEKRARKQLGALMRKFQVADDPRNPHPGPGSRFRWDDAGTNRIDIRGQIPVFHVNDRCALLLFILPVCAIGHIEIHGDLFEHMAAERDAKEATARPNEAP